MQTKKCYNRIRKRKEEKGMLSYEKYREIQTDLLQLLRYEEDKKKATEDIARKII